MASKSPSCLSCIYKHESKIREESPYCSIHLFSLKHEAMPCNRFKHEMIFKDDKGNYTELFKRWLEAR
jgi:hypothetical protein